MPTIYHYPDSHIAAPNPLTLGVTVSSSSVSVFHFSVNWDCRCRLIKCVTVLRSFSIRKTNRTKKFELSLFEVAQQSVYIVQLRSESSVIGNHDVMGPNEKKKIVKKDIKYIKLENYFLLAQ